MRTTIAAIIIAIIFGSSGYVHAQTIAGTTGSGIEKEVDALFLSSLKAAEKLDYDKISGGVDDSHQAGFIVNGVYYSRYDSLINVLKSNQRSGMTQRITIQHKKISPLTDSLVLLTASGDSHVEVNNGQSFDVKFVWSFVYQRINGEWKVIHSHQSRGN